MSDVKLYRKRIIPQECILLEDDEILYLDQEVIITKWNTIHPKKTLHHGPWSFFIRMALCVSRRSRYGRMRCDGLITSEQMQMSCGGWTSCFH